MKPALHWFVTYWKPSLQQFHMNLALRDYKVYALKHWLLFLPSEKSFSWTKYIDHSKILYFLRNHKECSMLLLMQKLIFDVKSCLSILMSFSLLKLSMFVREKCNHTHLSIPGSPLSSSTILAMSCWSFQEISMFYSSLCLRCSVLGCIQRLQISL